MGGGGQKSVCLSKLCGSLHGRITIWITSDKQGHFMDDYQSIYSLSFEFDQSFQAILWVNEDARAKLPEKKRGCVILWGEGGNKNVSWNVTCKSIYHCAVTVAECWLISTLIYWTGIKYL